MEQTLQPGAAIRIRQGPFHGFDGTVTAVRGNVIACEVRLFGRATDAELYEGVYHRYVAVAE